MKNFSAFQKKLRSYSVLAGSLLAAGQVKAQIVYTNLNPDEEVGGIVPASFPYHDQYGIDLNNDGVVDFNLKITINGLGGVIPSQFNYIDALYGATEGNEVLGTAAQFYPAPILAFGYGNLISSMMEHYWNPAGRLGWNTDSYGGYFEGNGDHFFALRFLINNETHYGWIRIATQTRTGDNPDTINAIVRDFAYNSVPGEGIHTGQTSSNTSCDVLEPNNQFLNPAVISTNAAIHEAINPSGDKDFFKFNVTAQAPNIQIILSDLPRNYDMALFTHTHATVGKARNLQKQNDTIIYNNASAGSYIVKVYQKDNKFDASCYTLIVQTSASPFKTANDESQIPVAGVEVYPNPVSSSATIEFTLNESSHVTIRLFSEEGKEVMTIANEQFQEGNQQVNFTRSQLTPGIYFLEIKTQTGMMVKKVVIE